MILLLYCGEVLEVFPATFQQVLNVIHNVQGWNRRCERDLLHHHFRFHMRSGFTPSTDDTSGIRFTLHLPSNSFPNLARKTSSQEFFKKRKKRWGLKAALSLYFKILCRILCYAFSDIFHSHLTILSVLRHLCRCVAREPYAEAYPGCMGVFEVIKLQSIYLEIISMTYRGRKKRGGKKQLYFVINVSVSQTQLIYCEFFSHFFSVFIWSE